MNGHVRMKKHYLLGIIGLSVASCGQSSLTDNELVQEWREQQTACLSSDLAACQKSTSLAAQLVQKGMCLENEDVLPSDARWVSCNSIEPIEGDPSLTSDTPNLAQFAQEDPTPQPPAEPVNIQSLNITKYVGTKVNGLGLVVERDYYPTVRLTAIVDEVTVYGATANRGNCSVRGHWDEGITLRYGEHFEFYTECDPIEVQINTSMGKVGWRW